MKSARIRRGLTGLLLVGVAVIGGAASLAAQTLDPEAAKARQLVERIRRSMREIDALLLSGSELSRTVEKVDENIQDMERLLEEAESKSDAVLDSIQELIDLAKYQQQQQQQQQQQNQSPEQQQQQQQQNQPQREQSEDPQQLQQQERPDESQQQPDQGDPKDPRPDSARPEQEDTQENPPPGETGEFEMPDTTGRWGVLPPKVAEDLLRQDIEDFPERYRYWMELYFRRVNRLRSGR